MRETDVEIIIQRAKEIYPLAKPRIISDNGPQFIARDFKEFIRISGMSHVRTSPYYPQSNGKLERWYQTLKSESIRQLCPLSLEDARRIVADFVEYYNKVRFHSALGYITPWDKLLGREDEISTKREGLIPSSFKSVVVDNSETFSYALKTLGIWGQSPQY